MNTRYWMLSVVAAVVFALPTMAFRNAQTPAPSAAAVKIDNFSFTPQTLTVKAGTSVTWTNADDIPHTVVADDKSFKSKVLDTDEQFTYTFTKPGTYTYFCSIHPKMTGK